MKVAIIGAGAAGLVTAHLLGQRHEVSVFERQPMLGGNVRTLGKNVTPDRALEVPYLDAGAIEFEQHAFPRFFALMAELQVALESVGGTTSFFPYPRGRLLSAGAFRQGAGESLWHRLDTCLRAPFLLRDLRRFHRATANLSPERLAQTSLARWLPRGVFGRWLRLLMMYAYSIPAEQVPAMPAAMTVPVLRNFTESRWKNSWRCIRGGVYTYMERILAGFPGRVHTGVEIRRVSRSPSGVCLQLAGGDNLRFDHVVFAATPEVTLGLLAQPTEAEQRRFAAWRANPVRVSIHYDEGPYLRRNAHYRAEFDLFALAGGRGGYNCYLNRLCGLSDRGPRHWGLAFGLDDELDPAKIVHRQTHHTPGYTTEALRHREEVLADNGAHRTWHVGAWLGNGLHEGAVVSAERVALALGGRGIGS